MRVQLSLLDTDHASALGTADRAAVAALEAQLSEWRRRGEERPALALLANTLAESSAAASQRSQLSLVAEARDLWLSRLRGGNRGESTQRAYRNAVDDLLAWAADHGRDEVLLTEAAMVEHLDHYQRTRSPMPATYHRRFILLRRFVRWVCERHGLVLLALVTTGLRRAELIGLDWQDLVLDGPQPSALVRGKGDRPRRQPLAPALVDELRVVRDLRRPEPTDPVFCGLQGGRLSPKILAAIVNRNAIRAGLQKRVTAHTLRHTAATWLRQQTSDARLVAEFLGHADLSTVARYAHVAPSELHEAAAALSRTAIPSS